VRYPINRIAKFEIYSPSRRIMASQLPKATWRLESA
jgi:hypothetical protein